MESSITKGDIKLTAKPNIITIIHELHDINSKGHLEMKWKGATRRQYGMTAFAHDVEIQVFSLIDAIDRVFFGLYATFSRQQRFK